MLASRYTISTTPYAGVFFNGLTVQLIDNQPTRDIGWDRPVSGHIIREWIVPQSLRRV